MFFYTWNAKIIWFSTERNNNIVIVVTTMNGLHELDNILKEKE